MRARAHGAGAALLDVVDVITRNGVVCHEIGHFLACPTSRLQQHDLRDRRGGIMGSGSWNGSDGKSPRTSAPGRNTCSASSADGDPSGGGLALAKAETNAAAHLVRDGMSDEYFMVENRARHGLDNVGEIFPGSLIEHVYPQRQKRPGLVTHPVGQDRGGRRDNSPPKSADSEAGDAWTSTKA
jgi:hypothetical protein